MILSHEDLFNYYKTNFLLMNNHKFTLTELEDMLPWERETYIMLLDNWLEEKKKKQKGGIEL